jgi:hypothetical protein
MRCLYRAGFPVSDSILEWARCNSVGIEQVHQAIREIGWLFYSKYTYQLDAVGNYEARVESGWGGKGWGWLEEEELEGSRWVREVSPEAKNGLGR